MEIGGVAARALRPRAVPARGGGHVARVAQRPRAEHEERVGVDVAHAAHQLVLRVRGTAAGGTLNWTEVGVVFGSGGGLGWEQPVEAVEEDRDDGVLVEGAAAASSAAPAAASSESMTKRRSGLGIPLEP